jgi:peroxiredoxin
MAQLGQFREQFQNAGAAVFAISNEGAEELTRMRDQRGVDFITFLSDPDGEAARRYAGVYENGVLKPGTFVIGRDARIVYAYVDEDYASRPAAEAVVQAVQESAASGG